MYTEELKKSILDMAQGAIKERVDYEMAKLLDNILDGSTKPDAKRKLVLTLTITPDSERTNLIVETQVKISVPPANSVITALQVTGASATGEVRVVEMTRQVPGQIGLDGQEQDDPALLNVVKLR